MSSSDNQVYWTLLVRWSEEEDWSVEFGDWDLDIVQEEIENYKAEAAHITILGTSGEQAEIDQFVELHNKVLHDKRARERDGV